MSSMRWRPSKELSAREKFLMARLTRTKKLFAFLRQERHRLFDEPFQAELEGMYRQTGAGVAPHPPALMAMATLLQAYCGASDAEAVELTIVDLRWQLVLDRVGADEPAFSQGSLVAFRRRLIASDMDRRLLERTTSLALETKAFDPKKLPKTLRAAVDSAPLEGAGRVEDTFNLLAHAAREVLNCAASLLARPIADVARAAGSPLLLEPSVKGALDIEWSDAKARTMALKKLVRQLDQLERWVLKNLPAEAKYAPLKTHLDTLARIKNQDLEPDPYGGGTRIRQGVAEDRQVSISDPEMRHGRKSKTKRFNGYKRHILTDLDTGLVLCGAITPANQPEHHALENLEEQLAEASARPMSELHVDRGYVASDRVAALVDRGVNVICKPWISRNGDLYPKSDFAFDVRRMLVTCPAGQVRTFAPGGTVSFGVETCGPCPRRRACTNAVDGRTLRIADDELLQIRLRREFASKTGRAQVRERVAIEHTLAHVVAIQGRRARYRGARTNQFDLRRALAVQNLQVVDRVLNAA
jgi:hypothetical protein